MGNNYHKGEKSESEEEFLKRVHFIESSALRPFGEIQIYRFMEAPYEHILKHSRCFTLDDPSYPIFRKTLSLIHHSFIHKNIAKVHWVGVEERFGMCVKSISISSYWSFYSIRLKDLIQVRRKNDVRFTNQEIFYVARSLLQVSSFLAQKGLSYGGYRSPETMLSAEGYIKLYLLHLSPTNSHHLYFKALKDRVNLHKYLPLPPEYLRSLEEGRFEVSLDAEKQDAFFIGMVLLEMMIEGDMREYYSFSKDTCTYRCSQVWKDLGMLKYVYSKQLIQFMEKLLEQKCEKRFGVDEALSYLQEKEDEITVGGSLRMFEDQQHKIHPKISYRTSLDHNSSILNEICPNVLEKKLTVYPIRTLTKNPHKSNCGVSLTTSKNTTLTKSKESFSRVVRRSSSTVAKH